MSTLSEAAGGGASGTVAPDALTVEHVDITYGCAGANAARARRLVPHRARRVLWAGRRVRAAASRRSRWRSSATWPATAGSASGKIAIDGRDVLAMTQRRAAQAAREHRLDGLPGARPRAEPVDQGRAPGRGSRSRSPASPRSRRSSAPQEMLEKVRIADPGGVMDRYPHQLSGGMLQRVVIAMALASEPVAADPRRADDRARRDGRGRGARPGLGAARRVQRPRCCSSATTSAVIAKMCDRVGVLYAGELVEEGPALERVRGSAPPVHGRPAPLHPAPRHEPRTAEALDTIPGFPPSPGETVDGMRVRRSLRAGRGPLPDCEAPPLYEIGVRAALALPLPRARADAARASSRPTPDAGRRNRRQAARERADQRRATCRKTFHMAGETIHGLVDVERRAARRRDARAGRRVGQRQDDARAGAARDSRAPDDGARSRSTGAPLPATARRRRHASSRRRCRSSSRTPTRRSTAATRSGACCPASLSQARRLLAARRCQARLTSLLVGGAAGRALPADAPGAALGRAQAARRDRPRVRRRPADRRLRRADLGARRLGPGGDPQPAHRPAAPRAGRLSVHQPRPRRGPLPVRPDRGPVPRPADGDRPRRAGVRGSAPPLHRGAAVGRADARRAATARADPARGRDPERRRPAERLRVPHPLPAQAR